MTTTLSGLSTDTDFSLFLSSPAGNPYLFNAGQSTMSTSYQSASTSKWVSAVIILRQVANGALNLTDRPQDHIPGWPITGGDPLLNITLAQLLSFTSGLVSDHICTSLGVANFETCVSNIATTNIGNGKTPGAGFYYGSNHLQVAGLMAVKARGVASWQDLFSEFKTQTALFANSSYDLPSSGNPRLAGGMHWTGQDYADFLEAFHSGSLLPASLQTAITSDQISTATIESSPAVDGVGEDWHYGYGLWVECDSPTYNCTSIDLISSAGAFGAYPFISLQNNYWGIVAREGVFGTFPQGVSVFESVESVIKQWASCQK